MACKGHQIFDFKEFLLSPEEGAAVFFLSPECFARDEFLLSFEEGAAVFFLSPEEGAAVKKFFKIEDFNKPYKQKIMAFASQPARRR